MERELHLTADVEIVCPSCGDRESPLGILDGATLPTENAIPGAKPVADGLALSRDGHCFIASLDLHECGNCNARCYFVKLAVVNCPEVSAAWANKYFWQNEPLGELPGLYGAEPHPALPDIPEHWVMDRLEMDMGIIFDLHYLGPFVAGKDLEGPDGGMAYCAEGKTWKEAEDLLGRVWPLITNAVVTEDDDGATTSI